MKALRWYGREDLRCEDIPEPQCVPGHVKVKVNWSGICGTDLHEYRFGPILIPLKPHPITGKIPPITLGHEFSGMVVETGAGISSFSCGDRVTAVCPVSCGKCYYCMRNMPSLCLHTYFIGFHADGSMAEYIVVPESVLHRLPDSISDELGALAEPLACGVHAVRKSKIQLGDKVAILGAGPIGICTILAAKAAGASEIYSVEKSIPRGQAALAMGADIVINPEQVNTVEQIGKLTAGLGVDISFDCIGIPESGPLAVEIVRKAGTVVIVGMSPAPSPDFNFLDIMVPEKTILGSQGYADEINIALGLIAKGRINPSKLITDRLPLEDAAEEGFKELTDNPQEHLKILLKP